jgi:hypothetical protein
VSYTPFREGFTRLMNCKELVVTYIMITTISPLYINQHGQVRIHILSSETIPSPDEATKRTPAGFSFRYPPRIAKAERSSFLACSASS